MVTKKKTDEKNKEPQQGVIKPENVKVPTGNFGKGQQVDVKARQDLTDIDIIKRLFAAQTGNLDLETEKATRQRISELEQQTQNPQLQAIEQGSGQETPAITTPLPRLLQSVEDISNSFGQISGRDQQGPLSDQRIGEALGVEITPIRALPTDKKIKENQETGRKFAKGVLSLAFNFANIANKVGIDIASPNKIISQAESLAEAPEDLRESILSEVKLGKITPEEGIQRFNDLETDLRLAQRNAFLASEYSQQTYQVGMRDVEIKISKGFEKINNGKAQIINFVRTGQ